MTIFIVRYLQIKKTLCTWAIINNYRTACPGGTDFTNLHKQPEKQTGVFHSKQRLIYQLGNVSMI